MCASSPTLITEEERAISSTQRRLAPAPPGPRGAPAAGSLVSAVCAARRTAHARARHMSHRGTYICAIQRHTAQCHWATGRTCARRVGERLYPLSSRNRATLYSVSGRCHNASAGAADAGGAATAAATSAHICLSSCVAAGAPPQHEDGPRAWLSASRSSSSHLRSTSAVTRRPLKPGLLGPSPL